MDDRGCLSLVVLYMDKTCSVRLAGESRVRYGKQAGFLTSVYWRGEREDHIGCRNGRKSRRLELAGAVLPVPEVC